MLDETDWTVVPPLSTGFRFVSCSLATKCYLGVSLLVLTLEETGFSVDPYLAGSLVSETVAAIQGVGVITSTKVCPPSSYE